MSLRRPQITVFQTNAPIAPGVKILSNQVKPVQISASSRKLTSQFATASDLTSMVAKEPLAAGQVIELNDLSDVSAGDKSLIEMAVPMSSDKAPIGTISPGDYVELIATVGSGVSATSRVVAGAVKVIAVSRPAAAFGQLSQNTSELLVSLSDPIEPIAIAQAETAGSLVAVKLGTPSTPTFQGIFSLDTPSGQSTSSGQPPGNGPPVAGAPLK